MRRKRQSNHPERCPKCARRLTNRAAATSHYRKHVRDGEMQSVGSYFRWAGYWFTYGVIVSKSTALERDFADLLETWKAHRKNARQTSLMKDVFDRFDAVVDGKERR